MPVGNRVQSFTAGPVVCSSTVVKFLSAIMTSIAVCIVSRSAAKNAGATSQSEQNHPLGQITIWSAIGTRIYSTARSLTAKIISAARTPNAMVAIMRARFILPLFQEGPLNAGNPDEFSPGYHVLLDAGRVITDRRGQLVCLLTV